MYNEITNKDMKNNENQVNFNPDDFINVTPVAKVGNTYPDLYSQASYLNKDIDRIKDEMCEKVIRLSFEQGDEAISKILDAIYNFILGEYTMSNDIDESDITPDFINNIANEVYSYNVIAKSIMDLLSLSRRLSEIDERIELTKHNVLL